MCADFLVNLHEAGFSCPKKLRKFMVFDVSVVLLKLHVYVFIISCTYLCFIVRASWKISYIAKCCNPR